MLNSLSLCRKVLSPSLFQKHTRIQEEEELEGAVSRVAAAVPGVNKTDIHKILAEFTASKHAN